MNTNNRSSGEMPSSIVDAQLQRLLQLVDDYKKQKCEYLLDEARRQAKHIIRHTYKNSRNRLRVHISDDRQQLEHSLAAVRARRHTFIMQQKHQASRVFLDDSWKLLSEKLIQRWDDAKQRQQWVKAIIDIAKTSLPAQDWKIEYKSGWNKSEQKDLKEYVQSTLNKQTVFQSSPEIEAGIRISGGGAMVDGTLQGLLSDRVRIESEILSRCTNCIVHSTTAETK